MALEIFKLVGSVFVDTDKAEKSLKKADKQASSFGKTLVGGVKAAGKFAVGVGTAAVAAVGGMMAITESTREYRTEQGKLKTAFEAAGLEADVARGVYTELNGVLGDSGQAVEASSHLAKLCDTEEELSEWTTICTGVYAEFGDSLPIENLTEAANETAKTGKITGGLADALNWAGISEEEFQKKLDACNSEAEREALIRGTLIDLYGDSADAYRENNEALIEANKAQDRMNNAMAQIGAAFEPAMTALKNMGASLLEEFVPGVTMAGQAFSALLKGTPGAAKTLGNSLSSLLSTALQKLLDIVPTVVEVGVSLISTLAASLVEMAPAVVEALFNVGSQLLVGAGDIVSRIAVAFAESIPDWVTAIQNGLPMLLDGLVSLIFSIVGSMETILQPLLAALPSILETIAVALLEQVPILVPQLLNMLVSLVTMIVEQLPILLPQLLSVIMTVIQMLTEQLPVLIPQIIEAAVAIVTLLTEQLPVILPMLIEACVLIVMGIVQALPSILSALVSALPAALSAIWDLIVVIFEGLPEWFGQLWEGAVAICEEIFTPIVEFFSGIWEDIVAWFDPAVVDFFSDIFADAWAGIESGWSAAVGWFEDIWSSIQGAFSSVTNWFRDTFADAWQAVKDVFSTGGQVFDGIKEGIADVFKDTVNAIIRGINKVIKVPFDALNKILGKVKNVEVLGIRPFSFVTTLSTPEIPELEQGAVLERGQVGLLEGNGAEAVVPLHQNQEWISAVARDMDAALGGTSGGKVLDVLTAIQASLEAIAEAGICLDTGALVGALAQPMDRRLGQLQAAKGRL